jgi:hypothetical protein
MNPLLVCHRKQYNDCYHQPIGAVELSNPSPGPVTIEVDRSFFPAGVTLERAGWIPRLDARCLEEDHCLFVQLAFTEPQCFLLIG